MIIVDPDVREWTASHEVDVSYAAPPCPLPQFRRQLTPKLVTTARGFRRAIFLAGILGCGDAVAPQQDPPFIDLLSAEATLFTELAPSEGSLRVSARAAEPTFVVSNRDRFEIHVSSSSGDQELAILGRGVCGNTDDGSLRTCHEIVLQVKAGFSLVDVYPAVRSMGRYGRTSASRYANVRLFGVSEQQAIGRLSRHPLVGSAELNWIGFPGIEGIDPTQVANRALAAQLKIDARPPVKHNGILEGRLGDTIEVRYHQPDGSAFVRMTLLLPSQFVPVTHHLQLHSSYNNATESRSTAILTPACFGTPNRCMK
jgi:hypothetical protein